jgi:ABC-2 type transport system permease protein
VRQMLTLIRRELIEHRSSWAVTSVFGALFVLAALLALFGLVRVGIGLPEGMTFAEIAEDIDPSLISPGLQVAFTSIATILNIAMTFVVFFYLLDALYTERRDRSILFWKSLPVSDLRVVGSKYLTGAAAIPLVTVGVFIVTAVLVWIIGGLGLLWAGTGEALAAGPVALGRVTVLLIYALLIQSLWFVPIDGWLLLVSAFAKRAVLAWAVGVPALLMVAERTLLGSSHLAALIRHRFYGCFELAFSGEHNAMIGDSHGEVVAMFPTLGEFLTPGRFAASPSLWAGIAVGVLFLAGAVWLRRWRDEA